MKPLNAAGRGRRFDRVPDSRTLAGARAYPFLASLLMLLPALQAPLAAQDARSIAQSTFPSVVLITVEDHAGQPVALGSGFVVQESLVVTNRHVIAEGAGGSVRAIGQSNQLRIRSTIGVDPSHDLAILSVRRLSAPSLALYADSVPAVGSRVYAVGNPKRLEGTFSDGIVSGIRALRGDTLLQITAPISPGSSGGPVLDSSGRVVGVAVATLQDGQNLNFAVPVRYVSALLSAPTALRPLTPTRLRAGKGPTEILGSLGGKSVDGVTLGSLSWDPHLDLGFEENKLWFSLRNGLRERVSNVKYLLIFYDARGQVLDAREKVTYSGDFIRPGLALREFINVTSDIRREAGRISYRILDFTLEEE